jgi:glycosyltransferase involved in cell wall biosynthesis
VVLRLGDSSPRLGRLIAMNVTVQHEVWNRKSMTVTIGIPTFNRRVAVGNLLLKLNSSKDILSYKVLVIDDGSTDGTFEYLNKLNLNPNIFRIITRPNVGYARTFLELLETSLTEWVIVTSDDDDIDLEALNALQRFFHLPHCSVLVTDWEYKDGTLHRGGRGERLLVATDLEQTMHAPGIAYRPSMLMVSMLKLKLFLDDKSEAAFFYPQVFISSHSIAARGAMFSPITVVKEINELSSGLISTTGRNYWHPRSRINQYMDFVEFFLDLESVEAIDSKEFSRKRLELNRQKYLESSEDIFALDISRNEFRKQAILLYSKRYLMSVFRIHELRVTLRNSKVVSILYRKFAKRR